MSNDKPLSYFDEIPTDTDRHGDLKKPNPLRARNDAYNTYLHTVTALVDSVREDFRVYNANGDHAEWVEAHKRRIAHMNTACNEFRKQITLFGIHTAPLGDHNGSPVIATPHPDKLEQWPGETEEEHEHRLFKDFGIRVPATKPDPGAIIFPPDPTVELLTSIRELVAKLVDSQIRPTVNFNAASVLDEDPTKLWESFKGVDGATFRKKLFGETAQGSEQLGVRGPQPVGHLSEFDQGSGQHCHLIDESVNDLLRRRGLTGHPLAERFSRLLDDTIEILAHLVRETHDETSPSADGCSDPTLGDGPVAGVTEETPAIADRAGIALNTDPDIGVTLAAHAGHNYVEVRLLDRTAFLPADTAFLFAAQVKRTAEALDEGWGPSVERGCRSVGEFSDNHERVPGTYGKAQDTCAAVESDHSQARVRSVSSGVLHERSGAFGVGESESFSGVVEVSGHETSPSVDGGSSPTVGDGPVAGAPEEAPATTGTAKPDTVETTPGVVYAKACLADAIAHESKLRADAYAANQQIKSCELDLESARQAAEASRNSGAGRLPNPATKHQ